MQPRALVHMLGLCNIVAGAFLMLAPELVPVPGADTPAGRLLGTSAGIMLWAIALGGWRQPPNAVRSYLWIFGVGVKVIGAGAWGTVATATGASSLWAGALADLALALTITVALRTRH